MDKQKKRLSMMFDTTKGAVSRRLSMLVTRGDVKDKLLAENGVDYKVFWC